MRTLLATIVLLLFIPAAYGQPANPSEQTRPESSWVIDTNHSELSFRIRHLVSRVRGTFRQWEGRMTGSSEDWSTASAEVVIQTASIDTNHERRDNHLRSDDFFHVEKYPVITFRSTSFEINGEDLRILGELTMNGVTRPVVLEGALLGTTVDGRGRQRAGFEAETRINRQDFGLTWNRREGGGLLLGDEVTITMVIQAIEG